MTPGPRPGASAPHIRPLRRRSEAWVVAVARGGGHEVATGTHQGRTGRCRRHGAPRWTLGRRARPGAAPPGGPRGRRGDRPGRPGPRDGTRARRRRGGRGRQRLAVDLGSLPQPRPGDPHRRRGGARRRRRRGRAAPGPRRRRGAAARRRGLPRRPGGRPRLLPDRRDGRRPARGGPFGPGLAARGVLGEHHRVHGPRAGDAARRRRRPRPRDRGVRPHRAGGRAGRGPRRRAAAPQALHP